VRVAAVAPARDALISTPKNRPITSGGTNWNTPATRIEPAISATVARRRANTGPVSRTSAIMPHVYAPAAITPRQPSQLGF